MRDSLRNWMLACAVALLSVACAPAHAPAQAASGYRFNDIHLHLTNYVQEGTSMADYVRMMGTTVRRAAVFGIPLQQMWQYGNTGDFAPTYYLQTDAPLYYYSFTDAVTATQYLALPAEQQARLDPMIIGFNPADMYAADHIRRVLLTFPGVFSGIGEFTIHKEFVSGKIAGGAASLPGRAMHRVLAFAAETGLVVLIHNDADMPFPRPGQDPYMITQMRQLFAAHPEATIVWAHMGVGRVVRPLQGHLQMIERALSSDSLRHLYLDISWDETAKYVTETPATVAATAALINRYPDRFLFGSDVVSPDSIGASVAVYDRYAPLWEALTPDARRKVLFENYERLFDAARVRVRAWEAQALRTGAVRPAAQDTVNRWPSTEGGRR